VRDRCRQRSEGCHPGQMGELRSELVERLLREPTLRHVLNRAMYSTSPSSFRVPCATTCIYFTEPSGIWSRCDIQSRRRSVALG
jgi:hypothetical protein